VADDSRKSTDRDQAKAVLQRIHRQTGFEIRYAGLDEKIRFLQSLIAESDVPSEIVKFALFDTMKTGLGAYGANRNALLLETAGDIFICVDDDTECRISVPPGAEQGLFLMPGKSCRDPSGIWNFPSRQEALAAVDFQHLNFFGMHDEYLGKSIQGRNVRITLNGLIGDCGWGGASKYLFLEGEAFGRLTQSRDHYEASVCSREMLRVVPRPMLMDSVDDMMTTVMGVDNRTPLPPFLPVARGEDIVFARTLAASMPDSGFIFLPAALLHQPVEPRAFRKGEIIRSASGVDLSTLLSELIGMFGLKSLPQSDWSAVRAATDAYVARISRTLGNRISADTPDFWVRDAGEYLRILNEHSPLEDFSIPLDLRYGRPLEVARKKTLELIHLYGRLLIHWPEIVRAASKLKEQGMPLMRPLTGGGE